MTEIKVGDTIIITAKKFLHAYPIGTVCKVQGIYTNENPYQWHKDGKNLAPDYDVKINAWNDHYGGYHLYEGEYEMVETFDAKTEIDLIKARIEALEAALQRVPYADYDRNMVITEATVGRSNGLTYPVYGDSYTGDWILIIKSVIDIKWKEGFCCDIVFKHQKANLKRVVYSDVLFEVTDGNCNGNEDFCTYVAASISPMSEQLFYEAKERINKI